MTGIETPNPGGEAGSLFGIIAPLLNFSANVFDLVTVYTGQFSEIANDFVTSYLTAQPQAIPGLPRCKTRPLESQVCAIWYILQHTLFSGAVGSVLIPGGQILIYMVVISRGISLIRAIIVRLGRIRDS